MTRDNVSGARVVLRAWDERDSRIVKHRGKRKIHFFREGTRPLKEGERNGTTGKNIFIGLDSDYICVIELLRYPRIIIAM